MMPREWQSSWSCSLQIRWAWWLCYTWKKELVWAERWEEQDILDLEDSSSPWLQLQASFPLTEIKETSSCPLFVLQHLILVNEKLICRPTLPSNEIKKCKVLAFKSSFHSFFLGFFCIKSIFLHTLKSKYYMIESITCCSYSISIFT